MKLVSTLACVALLVAVVAASTPPAISQSFTAKVSVRIIDHHGHGMDDGTGIWAASTLAQAVVQKFEFNRGEFDSFVLDRYDLGKLYRVESLNKSRCDVFPVEDKMPNPWGWLANATNIGQQEYQGKQVDVWELQLGYGTRRLAVWSNALTIPAFLSARSSERDMFVEFATFSATAPDNSVFAIPAICQKPYQHAATNDSEVSCISSASVIANANIWLSHKVPYNINGVYMN